MSIAILGLAGKLLDKFIPDPEAKAKAQLELAQMQANGELAKMANDTKVLELNLQDGQQAHQQQQETIRNGDNADDEYVRQTRPKLARQSWYGGLLYAMTFEAAQAAGKGTGADLEILLLVLSPALAYIGFRTFDKSIWGRK